MPAEVTSSSCSTACTQEEDTHGQAAGCEQQEHMPPVIVMLSSTAKLVDTTIPIGSLPIEPIGWLPIDPTGTIVAVPRPPLVPLGCCQFCICPIHSPVEALSSLLYGPMTPVLAQASLLGKERNGVSRRACTRASDEQGVMSCRQAVKIHYREKALATLSMQYVHMYAHVRYTTPVHVCMYVC